MSVGILLQKILTSVEKRQCVRIVYSVTNFSIVLKWPLKIENTTDSNSIALILLMREICLYALVNAAIGLLWQEHLLV